jgi:C2H2 type zinc finger protein
MARPRRTPQTSTAPPTVTAAQNGSPSAGEFTCPECGKTFTRAASLGAHRNRAHGIAGAKASKRTTPRRRRTPPARTTTQTRSRDGAAANVDRDSLLQQLFPNGLPAREAVIRAANDWLDQAEQLAKLK